MLRCMIANSLFFFNEFGVVSNSASRAGRGRLGPDFRHPRHKKKRSRIWFLLWNFLRAFVFYETSVKWAGVGPGTGARDNRNRICCKIRIVVVCFSAFGWLGVTGKGVGDRVNPILNVPTPLDPGGSTDLLLFVVVCHYFGAICHNLQLCYCDLPRI